MQSSFRPKGIYCAQWIPTTSDGELDRARLTALVEFERHHGIHGILALGSTGEFPHFTVDERKRLLVALAEVAAPLPVLANITDIRPKAAIELGRFARELGLPAVALMPPVFYPVSQADMLAYFLHIAEAVQLPVMLYNFPELTGKRIDPATVAAFADRAEMCAVKQSGGEFAYHETLVDLGREKGFSVMSGADTRLPEVFGLGADGCIGGMVNMVPDLMVHLYRVCVERVPGDAMIAAGRMRAVGTVLDQLTFPLNVGAGLEARGLHPGEPKAIVSPESRDIYGRIVQALRALFEEWQLEPFSPSSAAGAGNR
jgi:dihydrodipicolinate synthase/N-acetylneuraminate lyase